MRGECDFGQGTCAPRAVNDHVLQKLIFSSNRDGARKRILKRDQLDVETARHLLEADESLKATEQVLSADTTTLVQAVTNEGRHPQKKPPRCC